MPVRFRCDTCNGKLSIATRKIGTPVECPRCNESMIVPSASQIGEELTELLMTVGKSSRELAERRETASAAAPPSTARSAKSLDEMPLFERSDFDKLLDPRVKAAQPLPLPDPAPLPPAPVPPADLEAIVISRTKATVLAVVVVALLGLAFGLGYLARGFAIPSDRVVSDR